MAIASAAAKAAGIPKENVFLLEGQLDGYSTLQDLIRIGKSYGEQGQIPSFKIPKGKTNFDVCGFLSFSSGTTGMPKAVSRHCTAQTIGIEADPNDIGHDRTSERDCPVPAGATDNA